MQADCHTNGVWAVAAIDAAQHASPHFITAGADARLHTWQLKTDDQVASELQEHNHDTDKPDAEAPSADPCQLVDTFKGHTLPVVDVAVAANVPRAASTSLDGVVRIWNLQQPSAPSQAVQIPNLVDSWAIALSKDGEKIVTAGANGQIQIIDGSMGTIDETMSIAHSVGDGKDAVRRDNAMIMSVALSEDDRHAALGTNEGSVVTLDVETGKVISTKLPKHGGPVRSICYLPGEPGTVVTASDDQLVNLYDVDAGQLTGSCRAHTGLVLAVAASPDGKYLVSGGSDRSVHVWDRGMKESVYSYKGHRDCVWGVGYALEGSRIVSVGDDGCISVLDSSKADVVM